MGNVILAAVQKCGDALRYASEEMKNNENVILAAVQKCDDALRYASEDIRTRIQNCVNEFGCTMKVAALALAEPRVVQVSASSPRGGGYGEQTVIVTCTSLGGEPIATVSLEAESPEVMCHRLREEIARSLHVPPPVLQIILPSG